MEVHTRLLSHPLLGQQLLASYTGFARAFGRSRMRVAGPHPGERETREKDAEGKVIQKQDQNVSCGGIEEASLLPLDLAE